MGQNGRTEERFSCPPSGSPRRCGPLGELLGSRRDEVTFHPAWDNLMRTSVAHGVHSLPSTAGRQGAHLAPAALMMITAENELGHTCPISMTYSGIPALRQNAA